MSTYLVISHEILLPDTSKESGYKKIKAALVNNAKQIIPSLEQRGKYVKIIREEPYEEIQAYIYDNTGFVLFEDNYLVSAIINIDVRQRVYDSIITISMTSEPKPSQYCKSYSKEKTLEFDKTKIRMYWVDTIKKIRDYLNLEPTREVLEELYPLQLLAMRQNNFTLVQKKIQKFNLELALSFQVVMAIPLLATFAFVYYDRGEYVWDIFWWLLSIGPVLYLIMYVGMWLRVKPEKVYIESILKKINK